MTPGVLRQRFSLAIAVLVHAIIVVLVIGFTMIPRSPAAGNGGGGVGLEYSAGAGDVDSAPAVVPPPTQITADAPALPPMPAPEPVKRMEIKPGGVVGGDLFLARVRAHLARFRRELPQDIRTRGVVELRFRLSVAGVVSDARVARSSGDAALDAEALDLLARASPLPSRGRDTALIVPIEFSEQAGSP
ncbi:MAG: TonB family protein [Cupriavidus sp.]|nr:MAG: TonB family protein [Cupriavidus sp.]